MKTYQTLISEARELLQDTNADAYRWEDSTYINLLNRGLQELARLRPDAFWDTFATENIVVPEVTDATLGTQFPLDGIFYPPLVHYVTGAAELTDDEFTTDGRAGTLLSAFKQAVVSL